MTTDTSEKGLESLIVAAMIASGWAKGDANNYDREYAVDLSELRAFLMSTQEKIAQSLDINNPNTSLTRDKFLGRLQGEITKRGIIDVLRHGIKHGSFLIELFYGTPSPENRKAAERYAANRFTVVRQLRYSRDEMRLALDLCLFINGLPIITFELKNSLTKQTVEDAIQQYKRDRDSKELLFQFGRCMVHFAVDDHEVRMCTHLKGKASWFLPFNQGWNDGAGNPPNPNGLKTEYLWKRILTPESLTNILENYAQIVEEKNKKTSRKEKTQIFPRYHQIEVVRQLLADAEKQGVGQRYLIQHSTGSGKSNSIAWLAYQLTNLRNKDNEDNEDKELFNSIIVVTDRRVLDQQIRDTIKQFAQVSATVGHAENSKQLHSFIVDGKKIIITTIQKFPVIVALIGNVPSDQQFAIIIDEAHSSQGGRSSLAMSRSLSNLEMADDDESIEDKINREMEKAKMLKNASYFAFTATPKSKTLEIFGQVYNEDGQVKHRPFHSYTMKQAIQEGFILDVLKSYTPVQSYYKLIKTIEGDPEFDSTRARKKLRRFVESHDYAIGLKAEIIVDHFHEQVAGQNKIGGEARAMIVTNGIERAIKYFYAIRSYLKERKSPYQAIIAFSGDYDDKGIKVNEASLNGFSSSMIVERFQEHPYRFLICADKFQTGYDEPLLHTMYVDKTLTGIKAVQTLSRLNRAHPQKYDTFILDFLNNSDTISEAFEPYYRTTILSDETDPNKLHDLKATLDNYQVYDWARVEEFVEFYLSGLERSKLDPILDNCVAIYKHELDEDGQVDFKGSAKAFTRTYNFLSSILPYSNSEWEKLSIFLNFLIPKLPAPREEDFSKGILEAIDLDSYRVEIKATQKISLLDKDVEIDPLTTNTSGHKPETSIEPVSVIVEEFNDLFGSVGWKDVDKVRKVVTEEIPAKVALDKAYQNAKENSDKQNAKIENDKAVERSINDMVFDHIEIFKLFSDDPNFRKWVCDTNFRLTYGVPIKNSASVDLYPEKQAMLFVQKQFGKDKKWIQINQTIWDFFRVNKGKRLGLSDIKIMAADKGLSVNDFLSTLGLLAGHKAEFIKLVYYKRNDFGEIEDLLTNEIMAKVQDYYLKDEVMWQKWAINILVGWEPVENPGYSLSSSTR